ncbi:hypothetical protein HOY80DRAFT_689848 [Tuber brumale]|nr:hypothetical protein HOY80DRAFT_689848 [Tuber brumale]
MDRCQISCTVRLDFWIKCHRTARNEGTGAGVHADNAVTFPPAHGTVPTVGTNEKDACPKTKRFPAVRGIISVTGFDGGGMIFPCAISYDSSEGRQYMMLTYQKKNILLHMVGDGEAKHAVTSRS